MTALSQNYKPAPPLADLNPGVDPVEYNVLVLVSEVMEKTAGGIIRTHDTKDLEELQGIEGLLVAVSPMAFRFEDAPADMRQPQRGDRITFAKWAGGIVIGEDGRRYRLMKDKDITGVRRAPHAIEAAQAA